MSRAETEVLLVGAGPIGIEMAVALKSAGIEYVHLEAGQIASTIEWFPPEMEFFSSPDEIAIAGVPFQTVDPKRATREEYLAYLGAVVDQFGLEVFTFERVSEISLGLDGSFLMTSRRSSGQRTWVARKVILAIGDLHHPRKLEIPGEDLRHVSHYLSDPRKYVKQRVIIVGGKNSAVEAVIRCARVGARVTLTYRGEHFDETRVKPWLVPAIHKMIRDGEIDFLPRTVVREIRPDRVLLERTGGPGDRMIEVGADCVLLLTGYEQDAELFEQSGVQLEGEGGRPRFDERTMETNTPGLYVAGTASAGTQLDGRRELIETSHVHVKRIIASLKGEPPSP